MSHYRFIDGERAASPIAMLCRVLDVARSGYDAWRRRPPSARQQADEHLRTQIVAVHQASRETDGAPRIHAALPAQDVHCGRKRVARLMRHAGLTGVQRGRRVPPTTVSDPTRPVAPNRRDRDVTTDAPNRLWLGDITSMPTAEGWLYLAVMLDADSRRVVGWAMAEHRQTELVTSALRLAFGLRRPSAKLVHHTDRGGQYTAAADQTQLTAAKITVSMSRRGDCDDNALAESFFATLKAELVDRQGWPTRQAARHAIFEWIDVFYHRQRLHSALGYCSPSAFAATFEDRRSQMMLAA